MSAARIPLALTDRQDAGDLERLRASGVRRLSFQVQNGGNQPQDYDFAPALAAGLTPEVWGVAYEPGDRNNNPRGLTLVEQAIILGAQAARHKPARVMADVEYAAKGTSRTRGLLPYVRAVRAGGWAGPVDLTTLGAPTNPLVNDFEVDTLSFLDTGGDIYPQAYANAFLEYGPSLCVVYWRRVGVPIDRINLMIELRSERGKPRYSGSDWLPLLAAAGLGSAASLFLSYDATPDDLSALGPLLRGSEPQAPPAPTPLVLRDQADALLVQALKTPGFQAAGTRIDLAHRLLRCTDSQRVMAAKALGGIL